MEVEELLHTGSAHCGIEGVDGKRRFWVQDDSFDNEVLVWCWQWWSWKYFYFGADIAVEEVVRCWQWLGRGYF